MMRDCSRFQAKISVLCDACCARFATPIFCCLCSRILSHKIFLGKSVFCRKKFEKEKRHIRGKYIPSLHKHRARKNIAKARSGNDASKNPPRRARAHHLFAILFFFFSLSLFSVELKEDREFDRYSNTPFCSLYNDLWLIKNPKLSSLSEL